MQDVQVSIRELVGREGNKNEIPKMCKGYFLKQINVNCILTGATVSCMTTLYTLAFICSGALTGIYVTARAVRARSVETAGASGTSSLM